MSATQSSCQKAPKGDDHEKVKGVDADDAVDAAMAVDAAAAAEAAGQESAGG